MQLGDVSTDVEVFFALPAKAGARLGDFSLLEPAIHGLSVERTFFTVVLPEGFRYAFDGNMKPIAEVARQVWRVEKLQEEYDRLNDVLLLGSTFEKARAGENLAQLRTAIEEERRAALENFRRGIGSLDESKSVDDLTREQRDELRKQVEEQKAKLDALQTKLARQDREAVARGGQAEAFFTDGKEGDIRARAETVLRDKELAQGQTEQEYSYRGKRNLRAQGWAENRAPGAGEEQTAQVLLDDVTNGLESAADSLARLLESNKVIAGLVVVPHSGPMPQTAVPGQPAGPGADGPARPPNVGGGGGGASHGGAYRGPGGEVPDSTIVPSGGYGFGFEGDGGGEPAPPETRAGLLSLPVHVPETGVVHRFEKLNGGARLTVSVGTPGAGRPLVALALFAAVALALLLTPRLLRRK
jgi:hypothetical protein